MLRLWVGIFGFVGLSACSGVEDSYLTVATESLSLLRVGAPGAATGVRSAIGKAAARLCDLAADRAGDPARNGASDDDPDDGAWDWVLSPDAASHSTAASPENLYGSVALAPWAALRLGESPLRNRQTLYNVLAGARANANVDSPPDFVFLSLLDDVLFGAGPKLARERYDVKVAAAGGASALAASLRDAHLAAATDGLFAYDVAWLALGAAALDAEFPRAGYGADFHDYVHAVVDDVGSTTPVFDVTDSQEPFYTQGLAWSLLVLSWSPGSHQRFLDVRTRLLSEQLGSGAFPYNATYPDGHLQSTAHALMALALTRHGRSVSPDVTAQAASWLSSKQADNGGFPYIAAEEYPLLDAEIALALYLSETRPGKSGLVPTEAHAVFALAEPTALPPLSAPAGL
jgi:hypothetical protein